MVIQLIKKVHYFRCEVPVSGQQEEDWDEVLRQAITGSNLMYTVTRIDRQFVPTDSHAIVVTSEVKQKSVNIRFVLSKLEDLPILFHLLKNHANIAHFAHVVLYKISEN